jgi:hypothetical protein
MDILEENNENAFFDKKNYFNAISFYLMTNLGSFTEEEIQNEETIKELKEVVAKKNGIGDSEFTTFEVSTIFVGGKKGHRMTARAEQAHVCREPSSRRAASPLHHIAPPARTPARRRSVGVSDHAVEVAGREYARR